MSEMAIEMDIIYSKVLDRYIEIEYCTKLRSLRFVRSGKQLIEKKTHDLTNELARYFDGEAIDFLLDFDISYLSPFEQKVLTETRKIKYGKTITYSELAEKIGSRAYRAVGNALGKNPIPIVIPCHRVVSKKGIGGYSEGIDIKTRLLELEQTKANNL
ncbi:MAG: methylated-DNA--[protein]-cysteine S-methyltransferase [Candidatus Methanoperedens sp.]|nr:methylated-DNA--[protein]-cysteine S-methyltransferase [Candidatus Methanoperedens sp.]CAG0997827.1 Methylated-DNA--protein-cysteine methyltransferase [Methanosarcinales archaeon]